MKYLVEKKVENILIYDSPLYVSKGYQVSELFTGEKDTFRNNIDKKCSFYSYTGLNKNIIALRNILKEKLELFIVNIKIKEYFRWLFDNCENDCFSCDIRESNKIVTVEIQCYCNSFIRFEDRYILKEYCDYSKIENIIYEEWFFMREASVFTIVNMDSRDFCESILITPYIANKVIDILNKYNIKIKDGFTMKKNIIDTFCGSLLYYVENDQSLDIRTRKGEIGCYFAEIHNGQLNKINYKKIHINFNEKLCNKMQIIRSNGRNYILIKNL